MSTIRLSIDCLADGAWGTLSGSACIFYLIRRYKFKGENRIHIFLYGSATDMNSLTKLTHEVNAELAAIQLAVKETNKCLTTLKDFKIKPGKVGPRLISDSQTCLSPCSCPSRTLDLSTLLLVPGFQETFTHNNLYFMPGKFFEDNINLLTRYNPKLLSSITSSFFKPPFLMPELKDRVTIKVENMMKTVNLPHI